MLTDFIARLHSRTARAHTAGHGVVAITFESEIGVRKRRVSENLVFGEHRLVTRAEVFHGVETRGCLRARMTGPRR